MTTTMNKTVATLRMLYLFLAMMFIAIGSSIFSSFLGLKLNATGFMADSTRYDIPLFVWLWTFVLFSIALLFFYQVRLLAQKRKRARLIGIGTAILLLAIFPYGTPVGVFLLWIMMRPNTKQLLVN